MTTVTLYGKADCCLCERARELLERLGGELPFELVERDITRDHELHLRYLERIPVIEIDGREAFELIVEEGPLRRALAAEASGAPGPDH